ncbi:caspase family protein [Novosphingobium sp. 1949]|uniref:Caspase family protein n=1 Tax=Novosphingobium organovorum TaxID=2930092 RepID=A0ABT0BC44_9SPHN|nr:caspase family protein [Novosphingobium organovorum]MCJ2182597.1 caspase family protein [Novosphingobium organovorum]
MALAMLVFAALPEGARAQVGKVALIIGNARYAHTTALDNPANDSRLIARSAQNAGFAVTLALDQTNEEFQKTLREFRLKANGAQVAMIYHAGHAIEGQGRNWLIPIDATLETEFDLPYEAINFDRFDRLLEALSGARTRMLVLDSCRNNPFGNSWRRGVRAVGSGMAQVEVDDVLIIYAAQPGQVALDGRDGNSPFAASLARRLVEPGLALQLLGGAIRDDVLASTGGKQRPFVSASMTGTPVYLAAPQPAVAVPRQDDGLAGASGAGAARGAQEGGNASAGNDRTAYEALAWQGGCGLELAFGLPHLPAPVSRWSLCEHGA